MCRITNCSEPVHTKKSGLCVTHYFRERRTGDPTGLRENLSVPKPGNRPRTVETLLADVVDRRGPDECWPAKKVPTRSGYVTVYRPGEQVRTVIHRLVYEHFYLGGAKASKAMHVDHTCHNEAKARGECPGGPTCAHRVCCNPAHLQLVSPSENQTRQGAAGRAARGR